MMTKGHNWSFVPGKLKSGRYNAVKHVLIGHFWDEEKVVF